MKKIIFIVVALFLGYSNFISAQLTLGVKAGLSTSSIKSEELTLSDGTKNLALKFENASYSPHFGLVMKYKMKKFYIQPEFILNTYSANYKIKDLKFSTITDSLRKETYQYLDIPLLVGYDFGFIRLHGGPTGHIFLASTKNFSDIADIKEDFKSFNLGWQAGLGFDLWKFNLDLRYEGNFSNFGDHFTVLGKDIQFSQSPNRFIAAIAIIF